MIRIGGVLCGLSLLAAPVAAQVDQQLAASYFQEANALCEQEGGRLWGVSLCGPMVFADPGTRTIATNQPAPEAARPAVLGYANAALPWGGTRWSTFVWQMIPSDKQTRGRMFIHELFHRVQPDLHLLVNEPNNDHLDTPDGRYWMQLEWRALSKALGSTGTARDSAIADALAFRQARRQLLPEAAENERRLEINEGLPQYTGTVVATASRQAALADAIDQLQKVVANPSFVRTFAYPSGAAYGLLLDEFSQGWTRQITASDDIGQLLAIAAHIQPAQDPDIVASRYGGAELKLAEQRRETERQARVVELRHRFVDGPVLVVPRANNASFITNGVTPIPGIGTVYPTYRVSAPWGSLEAELVLMSLDRSRIAVPAPSSLDGTVLTGEGWTLTIAKGWIVRPGDRKGDYRLVEAGAREDPHE